MGGIFSTPSLPAPTPQPATPMADPAEEARKEREGVIERNRRGRAGLIATSDRGVLDPRDDAPIAQKKSLLGD